MKKFLFVIVFLTGLSISSAWGQPEDIPVSGQPEPQQKNPDKKIVVTLGVKVEANYSNFIHSGISDGKSRMRPGITGGGFVDLGITRGFSIQGELLFHYKESGFDWGGGKEGTFCYSGVEIPIYAVYHRDFKKGGRVYAGLGPYTEFGFSAKLKKDGHKSDLYEKDTETELPIMKDSNSGFGVMLGYEFPFGLQVNAGYKLSVSNLLDRNSDSAKLNPQSFSLGLGYRFGK